MIDRYTKAVLTVIAGALVYLCVVLTAFPAVSAQTAKRPGDPTGPGEMVIVGWRATEPVPVSIARPVAVTIDEPLRVTGRVQTEQHGSIADRVVLVGWEAGAIREKPTRMQPLSDTTAGLPVRTQQR